MPQQQQQRDLFGELRTTVGVGHGLLQCVGMTVHPFLSLPGTQGESFYGRHAALGYLIVLPVYFAFWKGNPEAVWLFWFWLVSLAALVMQQVAAWDKRRQGYVCASRYSGQPWLPGADELAVKGKGEPALLLAVGFAALYVSPPLGMWLMLAGAALAIDVDVVLRRERARVRAMRDAQFEYQSVARRFRRR